MPYEKQRQHGKALYIVQWGDPHDLTPEGIREGCPSVPGVYILSHGSIVHYAGNTKTRTVKRRIRDHLPENEKDQCNLKYFDEYGEGVWFVCASMNRSPQDRKDVEYWLIRHFSPECNDVVDVSSGRYSEICVNPPGSSKLKCYEVE